MRIIAISATLPNIQDIGEWLRCEKKAVHCFDNTFRPLPLTVKTISKFQSCSASTWTRHYIH